MHKLFILATLLFLAACRNNDHQPAQQKIEPPKPSLSGKYFIDYTHINMDGKFKLEQYVEFNPDGSCQFLENFCEGLEERKDRYFLSNNKITFAESEYILLVKSQEEIIFKENISMFTCGNIEREVVLRKK